MVGRVEDRGLFGEDMQGSRKHRSTLDVLFKRTLSLDIARQQRSNLAIFENDAESCYDRILVNIAMLSARILGVPTGAILAHSETVRLMKYNIKTIYGTSEARYQGTDQEQLLAGTGQGSRASPAVWLSICITLVLAYTKHAPRGMKYSDPTGMVISERYADAFVDDTSLGFNDDPKERMNIIATMLETLTKANAHNCGNNYYLLQEAPWNYQNVSYQSIHWQWDKQGYSQQTLLHQGTTAPIPGETPDQTYVVKNFQGNNQNQSNNYSI